MSESVKYRMENLIQQLKYIYRRDYENVSAIY